MTRKGRVPVPTALAVVIALLAGACRGGPTDADPISNVIGGTVNPQISGFHIEQQALIVRPGPTGVVAPGDPPHEPIPGALLLQVTPADRQYEIADGAALELTVRTSEGDVEVLYLPGPRACVSVNGRSLARCDRFVMELQSIEDAYRLGPELDGIYGRFAEVYVTAHTPYATANVALLTDTVDVQEAMRVARRWPGVVSVETYRLGYVLGGPPPRSGFEGGLPVELNAPVPGDGKLQVQDGSTVSVEYRQPDGSILTRTVSVTR